MRPGGHAWLLILLAVWTCVLAEEVIIGPTSEEDNVTNEREETSDKPIEQQSNEDDDIIIIFRELEIKNVTARGAEISWDRIDNVTLYFIEIRDNSDENNIIWSGETEHNTYVIKNLNGCSVYNVTVGPSINTDQFIFYTGLIETLVADLNPVSRVVSQADEQNKNNLFFHISWQHNITDLNCLSHYLVKTYVNITNELVNVIKVNTKFATVKNLEYCVGYKFIVLAVNKNNKTSEKNFRVDVHYITFDPEPPTGLVAKTVNQKDEMFLNLTWDTPTVPRFCFKEFDVQLKNHWDDSKIKKTTDTNYLLLSKADNFDYCATYDIEVKQVSDENGVPKRSEPATTIYTRNFEPPALNEDQKWSTNDTITINWNVFNELNCSKLTIESTCNYTEFLGHGYKPKNGVAVYNITSELENINVTIKNLTPFTNYQCTAKVVAEDKESNLSKIVKISTEEDLPLYTDNSEPPSIVTTADEKYELHWKEPDYLPGKIEEYETVVMWKPLYRDPTYCQNNYTDIYSIESDKTSLVLRNRAYTNHSIQIRAKTGAGWGNFSKVAFFTSNVSSPGTVQHIFLDIKTTEDDLQIKAVLRWDLPCEINGVLEYFNISVSGTFDNVNHTLNKIVDVRQNNNEDDTYSYDFGEELQAEFDYQFDIAAKVYEVDNLGPATHYYYKDFPAGIPRKPVDKDLIHLDPEKGKRTLTSAVVMLPLFKDTNNGRIINYTIIVAETNFNPEMQGRPPYEESFTWRESMSKNFQLPYQATEEGWDYRKHELKKIGNMTYVVFNVGEDMSCKEISMKTLEKLYCNGPLKSDTSYDVRIRAFTKGGFADSSVFVIKTKSGYNISVIAGSIFGIILFGTVTTLALIMRNKNVPGVLQRCLHSSIRGSPVPSPFTRKKFIAHCQQLADNPGKLSNEFQLLQTLSMDLQMPTNAACLQANKKKNRYTDILPYDFSRVKLEVIDNDPNSDYINASFIKGVTNEDEYIACQGPKEETVYDFWRMIDQYDVKIIVMLTQFVENGKEKCHQYFPRIRETFTYERMSIRCISEFVYRTCIQRTLLLEKDNTKRTIIHLQFKDWPDHDVPEDFDPVINFCQMMRKHIDANKGGLIVVHCSAGIGRTGTLLAIDILLQQIRDNKKLDVFGTVYRLRRHRLNMVQRESQYAYIYNCIRQVLKNPFFLKSYKPPPVYTIDSNRSKRLEPSLSECDLVNNCETLTNVSTPADSTKLLCDLDVKTPIILRNDSQLHYLRPYKSANAIYSLINLCENFDSNTSSSDNMDVDLHGSNDSLYENVTPLIRSKSAHVISEPPNVTHNSLERDTLV